MDAPRTILLVGLPRSGTTWVASVLASAPGYRFVNEPDNERISFLGRRFKRDVPRFPLLEPGDDSPRFEMLWRQAVASPRAPWLSRGWLARAFKSPQSSIDRKELLTPHAPRLTPHAPRPAPHAPRHTLIKSVHAVLCVEWVCGVVPIDRVVVVMRHPLAILASWRRLKMPDAARPFTLSDPVQQRILGQTIPAASALERQALHLAVLFRGLEAQVKRHPDWLLAVHEDLCVDPPVKFRAMFEQLGLSFTPAVERGIASRDRAGGGFKPVRRAADEPGKWARDYTADELRAASGILERAGLGAWL